jgi:hypothetical protein
MRPGKFRVFFFIFSTIFLFKGQTCRAWEKLTNIQTFDIAVLGGSTGGIAAAIQAARMGLKVALIDRNSQPGGEWGNGFQALQFLAHKGYGGFHKELSDSLLHAFTREWKADHSKKTFYTQSAAAAVWEELIRKEKNISLFLSFQFDPLAENIRNPTSGGPKQIRIFNTKKPKKSFWIAAQIWIDGTREGDLASAFGCRIRTGPEPKGEFDLTVEEESRSNKNAFSTTQDSVRWNAFPNHNPTIQISLTRNPEKKSIRKPEGYQREDFLWLGASLQTGSVTTFLSEADALIPTSLFQSESTLSNACSLNQWVPLPQTLIEKAGNYPDLSWSQRDSVQKKARLFVQGLLWFAQNDTSLPNSFREKALQFGLPKSDFQDNDHFPPHILLTDASRVEGKMIFTERDWTCETGQRPVIHRNSVAVGSIETKKDGNPKNEKIHFTIPFETIVPVGNEQILCPVPFFATHDAAQNPAMEAVRIQLGQAAGVAAALSIRKAIMVSKVPVDSVQNELIRMKANMVFVEDVPASDPDFDTVQKTALLGWIQGYSARLDDLVMGKDIELWSVRSGFSQKEINELVGKSSRRDALKALLKKYQDQWKSKL